MHSLGCIQGAQWLGGRMGGKETPRSVLLDTWNMEPPERIALSLIHI